MGSGCIKVTKYFLFLFNLLFFILGALILGFGIWILTDRNSFISVLQTSSILKTGAYIFIGVGAVTMIIGLLGCVGAVNEIRCLLGLYFAALLLIIVAQITAGVLVYVHSDKLKEEISTTVLDLISDYDPDNLEQKAAQDAWDYVQSQVRCCGWSSYFNWTTNIDLMNRTTITYPCSCSNASLPDVKEEDLFRNGFCTVSNNTQTNDPEKWPVYSEGCMEKVEKWLRDNLGIILGACVGVAVIELLGMTLSICLCRHVHSEDYSKVPKY
ncbi:CD82 antigen [Trichosurus vulpecula]|uniref:CD82 antigen n=1 Tax=Trichosurus vulpecula TaxID=9337 RepID=UPI00186B0248|nr:CD82 antigen [Trichosurus vulpecula]XP_036620210.1 CD82 antigen [Trichosurus vulpecula]